MRGISLGAMMAAGALLVAAAPADAREVDVAGTLFSSGSITISWHGDPARGCAAAGLCGYSGSVSVRPDDGEYDFTLAGRHLLDSYSSLDVFLDPPVVRVKRREPGSEAGACVDVAVGSAVDVTTARAGGGRVRLGLESEGLSTARCAGPPDLSSLLTKLPRRARSLARIIAGRARVADFSGQVPFSKGRFSGTIRSTLSVGFGKGAPGTDSGGGPAPRDRRRLIRVADVRAVYRVTSFTGAVTTSFGPIADAPCRDLDTCGTSGSSRWAVDSARGTVAIDALARARRSDHGTRGALAAVRRGPAVVNGEGDLSRDFGTITADVSRAGGTSCHDTASGPSPGVVALNDPAERLTFELGGEDAFPSPVDLLRTGCPGPLEEDVLGFDAPAAGSASLGAFGGHSIVVRMRGSARFSKNGYSGSHSADLTLRLERVSIHAAYRRARGIE